MTGRSGAIELEDRGVLAIQHVGYHADFYAATIACIERAWCSRNHADGLVFATMLDTMMGMPIDASEQRGMMRTIIKNWSCLQHMAELTNG